MAGPARYLGGMIKRVGLWAFVVAGLAVAAWAAVSWVSPTVVCHGAVLQPGETCEQLGYSGERSGKIRTYEERRAIVRQQAPFGVLAGVGMAGFGVVLIRRDAKAKDQASSDIGP